MEIYRVGFLLEIVLFLVSELRVLFCMWLVIYVFEISRGDGDVGAGGVWR